MCFCEGDDEGMMVLRIIIGAENGSVIREICHSE